MRSSFVHFFASNPQWLWVSLALLLHLMLFVSIPSGQAKLVAPLTPTIEVSLLEPLPAVAPPAQPSQPPKPRPRPRPKPQPQPTPEPAPQAEPEPLAEAEPEPELTPQPEAPQVSESLPTAAVASAPPQEAQIVAARFDADYLHNPRPQYPKMSRKLREEGEVLLRVFVAASGVAEKVELKQSSGSSRLDQAAIKAVSRWRFVPATAGQTAVSAWVVVPITFHLES